MKRDVFGGFIENTINDLVSRCLEEHYVVLERDFNKHFWLILSLNRKINIFFDFLSEINRTQKLTLKNHTFLTVLLCLYLVDPATFLALSSILAVLFYSNGLFTHLLTPWGVCRARSCSLWVLRFPPTVQRHAGMQVNRVHQQTPSGVILPVKG